LLMLRCSLSVGNFSILTGHVLKANINGLLILRCSLSVGNFSVELLSIGLSDGLNCNELKE
jgi:hypothetical protein